MKVKVTVSLLALWCVLVALYLVNATLGVWINTVNPLLRPLPLVLLMGCLLAWFHWWPSVRPARRFALIFGLVLFAGGDVAMAMPEQDPVGTVLYFCGFLAYGVWAARGISTDQWRWVLIVPVVGVSLLLAYWLWPVYGVLREAMVIHIAMVGVATLFLVICPVLPWWAVAGPLLLAASQGLWAANEFLAGVPHATLSIMATYYVGHLLLTVGVLKLSEDEDAVPDPQSPASEQGA